MKFQKTAPSHVVCIEKTKLRTKEAFSLVLIKRDIIEKRSDNFTEKWVLVSKCIRQSNVKSFKCVADDIRQPKLSHKVRSEALNTKESELFAARQNKGK